jgi:hypothetical protein
MYYHNEHLATFGTDCAQGFHQSIDNYASKTTCIKKCDHVLLIDIFVSIIPNFADYANVHCLQHLKYSVVWLRAVRIKSCK